MKLFKINGREVEISNGFWVFILGTVLWVEGLKYMDLSFITRTEYFQGQYPLGAMMYLMMFSVVKTIATYACFIYAGYYVGRHYQKKEFPSSPDKGKTGTQ